MSFKAGNILIKDKQKKADPKQGLPSLSFEEIIFLLKMIKEHKFEGKDLEITFNTTLKLQQLYLDLKNKN